MTDLPRRFHLQRITDVTGASGTGRVADGVLWPDGTASVRWRNERKSIVFWDNGVADAEAVHGHGGHTRIVWDDDAPDVRPVPTLDHRSSEGVWAALVADLDRCEHGRHVRDQCIDCGGMSAGNPMFTVGQVIGYGYAGDPIYIPAPEDRHDPRAWRTAPSVSSA